MAEVLQRLILDVLNEQSIIADTRTLVLPEELNAADEQITILGALNSLLSREVSSLVSPASSCLKFE